MFGEDEITLEDHSFVGVRTNSFATIQWLGNMHFLLGDFERAVECYRRAVTILPGYAYAWGDLFLAYESLAERG